MKTYSYILLIVLNLICFNQKAMGQETLTKSVLIGSWTLDYNATFAKMERQMKTLMDTVPQAQRKGIENSYRDRTMVFDSGGGFQLLFPDGRDAGGSWSLEQNGNLLVLTDPNGKRYPHKVKELTSKGMVLKIEDSNETKLFVKELYFIKN